MNSDERQRCFIVESGVARHEQPRGTGKNGPTPKVVAYIDNLPFNLLADATPLGLIVIILSPGGAPKGFEAPPGCRMKRPWRLLADWSDKFMARPNARLLMPAAAPPR